MKKLITILLILVGMSALGQTPSQTFNGLLYQYNNGHYIKGSAFIPRDTVPWTGSMGDSGRIAYKNGVFYGRDGVKWKPFASGNLDSAYRTAYIKKDSIVLRRSPTDTTLLNLNSGWVNVQWYGPTGDSSIDVTSQVQSAIDAHNTVLFPRGVYKISGIDVNSNQTLIFQEGAKLLLKNNSNRPAIQNKNFRSGLDSNITIIGLELLGNDINQVHTPSSGPYVNEYTSGLRFWRVNRLALKDIKIYKAKTFGIWLAHVQGLTAHNIFFDQRMTFPYGNQDGIHVNGPASDLDIRNISGKTNDDMVAINADDAFLIPISGLGYGPIRDVTIDGLYADTCLNGIRLLSINSELDNVNISNITGVVKDNLINISAYEFGPGKFGRILIHNVSAKVISQPPIPSEKFRAFINISDSVESVIITDVERTDVDGASETIRIRPGSKIGSLSIRNLHTNNQNNVDNIDIGIYRTRIGTFSLDNHRIGYGSSANSVAIRMDSSRINQYSYSNSHYGGINKAMQLVADTIYRLDIGNIGGDITTTIDNANTIIGSQRINAFAGTNNGFTDGNFGIGTTAPVGHTTGRTLVLNGTSQRALLELWGTNSGKSLFQSVNGDTYLGNLVKGSGNGDVRVVYGNGTEAMVINGTSGETIFNSAVTASAFKVSALNTAPDSASATGTTGDIRFTSTHIYICIATNTWVRASLVTW